MYKLIHDELGTIEAETEKQLQTELRKRKREHDKQNAEKQAKRERAGELARLNGFSILYRLVSPDRDTTKPAMPSAWRVYSVDNGSKNYSGVRLLRYSEGFNHFRADQNNENGEFKIYHQYSIVGAVGNAHGAICLFQQNHQNEIECFAIGVHAGEVVLYPLPGVSISDFPACKP
jgi:hypothetical protein